jgi:hypothetical protein
MSETVPEGMMEEGLADDIYKDMFYLEVARNIGESGALGIARTLERSLRDRMGPEGLAGGKVSGGESADKVDRKVDDPSGQEGGG